MPRSSNKRRAERDRAVHDGELRPVVVGRDLLFEQAGTRSGRDHHRRVPEVGRALRARDDDRDGSVGLLATVEEADARLGDPTRFLVIFERDRILVAPRGGIRGRVLTQLHDRATEVGAGDAEVVHVTRRVERHPRCRCQHAEGHAPLHRRRARVRRRRARCRLRRAEPARAGSRANGSVRDDGVRGTAHHRARGVEEHAHRAATAVRHAARPRDLPETHRTHELGLFDGSMV